MAEYDDRLRPADRNAPYDTTRNAGLDSSRTAAYVERPGEVQDVHATTRGDDSSRHHQHETPGHKNVLDWLALILLIIGGLNWGLVGLFGIDIVASIFGPGSMLSRVVYIAVGVAAIWGFALTRLGPTRHH